MAESAFNFNSAPGGKGVASSKGRQFGGGGEKGLSARALSHLSAQSHAQNKDLATHVAQQGRLTNTLGAAVNHVLSQESSKQTHKQGMAASRLGHKQELEKASQKNMHDTDDHTNRVNAISRLSGDVNIKSANTSTGAFTTTHPQQQGQQFDGKSTDSAPLDDNIKA